MITGKIGKISSLMDHYLYISEAINDAESCEGLAHLFRVNVNGILKCLHINNYIFKVILHILNSPIVVSTSGI